MYWLQPLHPVTWINSSTQKDVGFSISIWPTHSQELFRALNLADIEGGWMLSQVELRACRCLRLVRSVRKEVAEFKWIWPCTGCTYIAAATSLSGVLMVYQAPPNPCPWQHVQVRAFDSRVAVQWDSGLDGDIGCSSSFQLAWEFSHAKIDFQGFYLSFNLYECKTTCNECLDALALDDCARPLMLAPWLP